MSPKRLDLSFYIFSFIQFVCLFWFVYCFVFLEFFKWKKSWANNPVKKKQTQNQINKQGCTTLASFFFLSFMKSSVWVMLSSTRRNMPRKVWKFLSECRKGVELSTGDLASRRKRLWPLGASLWGYIIQKRLIEIGASAAEKTGY